MWLKLKWNSQVNIVNGYYIWYVCRKIFIRLIYFLHLKFLHEQKFIGYIIEPKYCYVYIYNEKKVNHEYRFFKYLYINESLISKFLLLFLQIALEWTLVSTTRL